MLYIFKGHRPILFYILLPYTSYISYYMWNLLSIGDNILTALSVGRDCELVKPDQTVIRVEAELQTDQFSPHLNVSYTLEENEGTNIVHDVSWFLEGEIVLLTNY